LRELKVKTLRISEEAHAKLASVLGGLMAETEKMKTYSDAMEAILNKSVMLSQGLLDEVESFIRENSQLVTWPEKSSYKTQYDQNWRNYRKKNRVHAS
jgi:hypothetical protein